MSRVYLYVEQVEALLAGDLLTAAMSATKLDDGDVFHLMAGSDPRRGAVVPFMLAILDRASDGPMPDGEDGTALRIELWPGPGGRASATIDGRVVMAELEIYALRAGLGSRAHGLIETDVLQSRTVAVIGLGSGGSPIALALAQAGVGRMILVDNDRLDVSNVARHICGLNDLGRYKTRAVADLLRAKNPSIDITTHEMDITADWRLADKVLSDADLIIAATDTDRSRFVLNEASLRLGIPALFGRALARASGGDVLRVRPRAGPCLACIFTSRFLESRQKEVTGFAEAQQQSSAYTSQGDVAARVQVGLASDIAPIGNMITKLALLELSRGQGGGLDGLDADLTCDFYTWANRRDGPYAALPPMGSYIDQPTILRWYGVEAQRSRSCLACSIAQRPTSSYFGGPE
jgi:molybdopterin/thiamine biosynthesis adenylyltransferase